MVQRPAKVNFGDDFIKDFQCGYNHCLALSAKDELYQWGSRMGVYPNVELTRTYLETKMNLLSMPFNQSYPRLVKNNLMFYKIKQIVCGPFNSCLVTDKGELLIQGANEGGQLGLGNELGPLVPFFPEFRKIDLFGQKMPVIDVALSAQSTHILAMAQDQVTKEWSIKMFAMGDNQYGQLGDGTTL